MAEANDKPIVTLTGITGYIGAETCRQFLEDGSYRVRGTVRDMTNEAKLAPIREAFGDLFSQLELREADLMNEQSMIDAIAGSTYVVHLASPFFMGGDEAALITPAVNGTLAAMKACKAAGVRRCVITSSVASVQNPAQADKPANRTYDESHWSNPDRPEGLSNYPKSKTLAEKAAWDFQAALPEGEKFEIATICPGFVMGPPLRKESFTSGGWLKMLMEGKMATISSEHMCVVDVRDVARAHLLAIKNEAAANKRYLLVHSSPSFQTFAAPIAAKYRGQGWPISEDLAEEKADEYVSLFNNAASKELGVVYTDFTKTMVDMADKMIELGTVVKPVAE